MGVSRHYLAGANFMLTKIVGRLDNHMLLEHVLALNEETHGLIGLRELGDVRGIDDLRALTVPGTTQCAAVEKCKPGSRLVILVPEDSQLLYGMARAYLTFSEEFREAVHLATNLKQALAWLCNGNEHEMKLLSQFISDK